MSNSEFATTTYPNPYFTPSDVSFNSEGSMVIDICGAKSPTPRLTSPSDSLYEGGSDDEVVGKSVLDNGAPFTVASSALEAEIFGDNDSSDSGNEDYVPPPIAPPELPHTITNLLRLVLSIPKDDYISSNLATLLGGTGRNGAYARPCNSYGQQGDNSFTLLHHHRRLFSQRLVSCAGLISAALNDHIVGVRGLDPSIFPVTVPTAALNESKMPFPTILVFLSSGWELEEHDFNTQEEVETHVEDFLQALRVGIAIFGKIMISAMRAGDLAVCNPGAGLQMNKWEFLARAGEPDAATDCIEAWLDQIVFSNVYLRCSDDACGRLFTSQIIAQFITIEGLGVETLLPRVRTGIQHDGSTSRMATNLNNLGRLLALGGY
ncbi:hypothetical protein C8R47DRAFT_1205843 [Mycena vitilis]|nr:hypothetical protein C8R47DRAFT_1205843 [Mycena vitilis]